MMTPAPPPGSPPRRSSRVTTEVLIEVRGEKFAYAGETVIVNRHGALIKTPVKLELGTMLMVHVFRTGQCAEARVVFHSRDDESHYGIELDHAENIWGVDAPPEDWNELLLKPAVERPEKP